MKLIDADNSDRRAELEKLRPIAREALALINQHKFIVSKAQQLADQSGLFPPEQLRGAHPLQNLGELITTYGTLALEVEE